MRFGFWLVFLFLQVGCSTDSPPADGGHAGQGGATAGSGGATTGGGVTGGTSGATTGGSAGTGGAAIGGGGAGGSTSGTGGSNGGSQAGSTTGGASGAGGSGGSGGAGGSVAGGGGSGGAFDCAGALFCETFESLMDGAAQRTSTWEPITNNGTLTLDAMHARGERALHVRTMGNGRAYIQTLSFAPPGNSFWGRMFLWVDAFPTAPNYAHYTLVEAAGTEAGLIRFIGGQYVSPNALWGVGSDGGPTGDWTNWKTSAPAEADKWLCMEWEVVSADNTVRVFIDGVAKSDLTVSTTMHGGNQVDFVFPTFNRIWFGWWLYQTGPTPNQFDLWMDDLALSTTRIGCN